MNVYEEIDQETMMLLLDSLCKRTVEGKQIWENMEYNPISFLQKDIYEKERRCGKMRRLSWKMQQRSERVFTQKNTSL